MSKGHPIKILCAIHNFTYKDFSGWFERSEDLVKKWVSGKGSATMGDFAKLLNNSNFTKDEVNKLCRDWIDWLRYENTTG